MTNSRLLEIIEERQILTQRLAALDQEEKEILTGEVCTDEEQIDLSLFKDTTHRLLTEFCNAPNKILSHEDIREDVMFDPEAPERNIRQTINRARKELQEKNRYFEIKNIRGKGYQLVRSETLHETSQTLRKPLNPRKNGKKRRNVR